MSDYHEWNGTPEGAALVIHWDQLKPLLEHDVPAIFQTIDNIPGNYGRPAQLDITNSEVTQP